MKRHDESPADQIAAVLRNLDDGRAFGRVVRAGSELPPPPLAFAVGFPSIVLPLSGRYTLQTARADAPTVFTLVRGDVMVVPANHWYLPAHDQASTTLTILFGRNRTGFSLVEARPRRGTCRFLTEKHHGAPLKGADQSLLEMVMQGQGGAQPHLCKALLLRLRESAVEVAPAVKSRARSLFEAICAYIQENYPHDFGRNEIAAAFRITPQHLSRLFQQQGLMTLTDYVTWVRIDRAKLFLTRYDLTIQEIAYRVGFRSDAYFCRIFKARTKHTPSEYRQLYASVRP